MKKELLMATALVISICSVAFAKDDDEYKYKSSTGNSYKYDLSKPGDKIKYSVDPSAQLRDSLYKPITPTVSLDEGLGQYGGGIKR